MARIRTIKPEFFTSEDIVNLSPLARLLYVALWCEADKEGRLVWKPFTFKLRYFPADDCRIADLCNEIVEAGLVVLYGEGYAYIPSFKAHQHINPRESVSQLPDPDAQDAGGPRVGTRQAREADASPRVTDAQGGREGKGREGLTPTESSPDKLPTATATTKLPACPHAELVKVYNEVLPELPAVRLVSDARKRSMAKFWRWVLESRKGDGSRRATTAQEAIDWIGAYFARVRDNEFLMGRGKRTPGHESWVADFDFLLTEKGMKHVIEKTGSGA